MSTDEQQIPPKVLADLCSRFIINIPAEQRDDVVRLFFAIELAHWFYMDFHREEDPDLPNFSLKEFAEQIFHHCPFLRLYVKHLDQIVSKWKDFKFSVPTYGAILLDPTFTHLLLVRGFDHRESWGFPKGKIQENESAVKCAVREVIEEVGFDIRSRIREDQFLENERNGQIIRLYIIANVPLDTKFLCKTKNEIKDIRWFPIADLPAHLHDTTSQVKFNLNPKAFFMAIPFIRELRRWIYHRTEPVASRRHRSQTFHGESSAKCVRPDNKSSIVVDRTEPTSKLLTPPLSNDEDLTQNPLINLMNQRTFDYHGPKCWRHFRLNRSAIHRCLQE